MPESLRSQRKNNILPGPDALERLAGHLEGADPQDIIQWAVDTYGGGLALSASFGGGEGMALGPECAGGFLLFDLAPVAHAAGSLPPRTANGGSATPPA